MKGSVTFLVLPLLLALAHALPRAPIDEERSEAANPNTDTFLILPTQRWSFSPMMGPFPSLSNDDDDRPGFFGSNPFRSTGSLFNRMQDAMNKFKEQMAKPFEGIGGLFPWGKIPEGANTTSTTKVIDGHVVTTNETTYTGNGDNVNSFFRIRTVDIKPQGDINNTPDVIEDNSGVDSPTDSTKESTSPRSVESVEDRNEIPDSQVETLTA